jgi:hypothetical protein
MAIWLCGWIGVSLFHGLSHVAHAEDGSPTACAVCHLFNQSLPASIETHFAVRPAPRHEVVLEERVVQAAAPIRRSVQSIVPRGPPTLLFI